MFVIGPNVQYCPNSAHQPVPSSKEPYDRTLWPLYGLEKAVAEYNAPTAGEAATPALPDLSFLKIGGLNA